MKQNTETIARRAREWMEAHRDEMIAEIQALSRIPSVSHPEMGAPHAPFGPECRRALDLALERGRHYGFETRDLDGYAGTISMGNDENPIGIFAHLDVVPEGDGWTYPPYGAVYLPEHDTLIGRGVDDNKGSMVMGLFVMRMLREWGCAMRHGIRLYCGTSEENGMHDMKALAERDHSFPPMSLVPDGAFPVNYGQKGTLRGYIEAPARGNLISFEAGKALNMVPDAAECAVELPKDAVDEAIGKLPEALKSRLRTESAARGTKIIAVGQAGHAAHPERGVNAIQLLSRALCEAKLLTGEAEGAVGGLCALTEDFQGISEDAAFQDEISGPLTLVYSVAALREGRLRVGLDCRYPISCPGEELKEKLERAWAKLGFEPRETNLTKPFYIPRDSAVCRALQDVYRAVTGREDAPYTMGGGTYSKAVPNAVTFGAFMPGGPRADFLPPGHGGAHGPDEALPLEKVINCASIYAAALLALDEL